MAKADLADSSELQTNWGNWAWRFDKLAMCWKLDVEMDGTASIFRHLTVSHDSTVEQDRRHQRKSICFPTLASRFDHTVIVFASTHEATFTCIQCYHNVNSRFPISGHLPWQSCEPPLLAAEELVGRSGARSSLCIRILWEPWLPRAILSNLQTALNGSRARGGS